MMDHAQGNMSEDELIAWVFGVDRRIVLAEAMKDQPILKASDIAQETNRSTQNISRALKEFKEQGFVMCLNPEKTTWKRYAITNEGRRLLKIIDDLYFSHN
ncbi:hypothetical protein SAMN04488696_0874 [Methanolobus profundi]|uniref:Uncharacterized protein n=2 Tax=Methanolobus profundi TaxID=487685 RepID=A0A1I4PTU0_9EURY|nr:hypothetical protein SAMN04488696_0874 [Methanolobus profundi]